LNEAAEPPEVAETMPTLIRSTTSGGPTIRELLDQPGTEDVAFDLPRLGGGIFRPALLD
jgi:hypothetical protein